MSTLNCSILGILMSCAFSSSISWPFGLSFLGSVEIFLSASFKPPASSVLLAAFLSDT